MDYDDRAGGSCPESSRTDRCSTHRHGYPVYRRVAMRTGYSVNRSASGCNRHLGQFKLRLNLRSFFWTSDHIRSDIGPPSASRQIEDSAGKTRVWGTLAKYFLRSMDLVAQLHSAGKFRRWEDKDFDLLTRSQI